MKNILFLLILTASACSSLRPKIAEKNELAQMMDSSAVLKNGFSGLVIYDLEEKKTVFQHNEHRYFVPASNTKTYTLYAVLKTLGDSIPALKYVQRADSLIFWGTGDPTFLHPKFQNERTFAFLKAQKEKKLFFSDGNFTNQHPFGKGWMWDDYNDAFQPELSPLPMYGNVVKVQIQNHDVAVRPSIFQRSFYENKQQNDVIQRSQNDNQFFISKEILAAENYEQNIPFKTSSALTQQLLIDTLRQNVGLLHLPLPADAQTLFSVAVDTVYRRMMQESDNMLAEHLLLLCGATLSDTLNSEVIIREITKKHFQDFSDAPKWADGSGISRYNLFTPRTNVQLLEKMYAEFPEERLFSLMAIGGKAGSIKQNFIAEQPYVFAKSGSMTGVYNLSGYLKTKSGKVFIFSFMNNNSNRLVSEVRNEVERIMTWVYFRY